MSKSAYWPPSANIRLSDFVKSETFRAFVRSVRRNNVKTSEAIRDWIPVFDLAKRAPHQTTRKKVISRAICILDRTPCTHKTKIAVWCELVKRDLHKIAPSNQWDAVCLENKVLEQRIMRTRDLKSCMELFDKWDPTDGKPQNTRATTAAAATAAEATTADKPPFQHVLKLMAITNHEDLSRVWEQDGIKNNRGMAHAIMKGFLAARAFSNVITLAESFQAVGILDNKMWNMYLTALIRTSKLELALELATASLSPKIKGKQFKTGYHLSRKILHSRPDTETSETESSSSASEAPKPVNITNAERYKQLFTLAYQTPVKSKSESEIPWTYDPISLTSSAYRLNERTFTRLVLALFRTGRTPIESVRNRVYIYGQTAPIPPGLPNYIHQHGIAPKSSRRFNVLQILYFISLASARNLRLADSALLLLLSQFTHQQISVTRDEVCSILLTISTLYPALTSHNFEKWVVDIGFKKAPKTPWLGVALLRLFLEQAIESSAEKKIDVNINEERVRAAVLFAVKRVYSDLQPTWSLIRDKDWERVRKQAKKYPGGIEEVVQTFNDAWHGGKTEELKELLKNVEGITKL